MRISCIRSHPGCVVTTTADRHAPAGWSRLAAPPAAPPRPPLGPPWFSCVLCVFCVWCFRSARGRADTSPRAPPVSVRRQARITACPCRSSPRPAAAEPNGSRVAHCQGATRPAGLPTRRSVRSSNLVRSRLPTSHEISQPAGGLVTALLAVWSPPHWRTHWQRDG